MTKSPLLLIILDGYAHNPNPLGNAVYHANKPNLDRLFANHPYTELITFGERVGLPHDQMGNSEVGHLNIGAGRVVEQELERINRITREGALGKIEEFNSLINYLKTDTNRALHLIGLVSTGGVHSSLEHLEAIVLEAAKNKIKNIFIHAITDGRDRPPTGARDELKRLLDFLTKVEAETGISVKVVSMIGRYFAMDRDNRTERTERALNLFCGGQGTETANFMEALEHEYSSLRTDEFVEPYCISPTTMSKTHSRSPFILENDAVLCCNFRADRMRQIVHKLLPLKVHLTTLTVYEEGLAVDVLFKPKVIKNYLGEVVAQAGLSQVRAAETEKYPHVTYFFNGGNETASINEERILIPSPRDVPTYDLKPQMSAKELTAAILRKLSERKTDIYIINFANCDMVGHTGVFDAAVKAVECVDMCVGEISNAVKTLKGQLILTADHGNADQMIDYETGGPHTFHTKYPVPFCIVNDPFSSHILTDRTLRSSGALCDIAPTICELLNINPSPEMSGRSLIKS
jgi:2,3-bisphosphoglycerate-independent phosphoglycerate mutase